MDCVVHSAQCNKMLARGKSTNVVCMEFNNVITALLLWKAACDTVKCIMHGVCMYNAMHLCNKFRFPASKHSLESRQKWQVSLKRNLTVVFSDGLFTVIY